MAKTLTQPWDAADHLENKEDIVAYLEAAFDDGDSRLITAALGDIAKSKGMTKIASEAGLGRRESLQGVVTRWQPQFLHRAQGNASLGYSASPVCDVTCPPVRWLR